MNDITIKLLQQAEKEVKEKYQQLGKTVTYEEYMSALNRYNDLNDSVVHESFMKLLSRLHDIH